MDNGKMPLLQDINIPGYVQIYDIIYGLIRDGGLQEGDTLPGENVLADYWKVSRNTVRAAVRKLEEDGYIYKMQGKRTTVTGQYARHKNGLQMLSNPCITSCVERISRIDISVRVQNGGRLIGDLLGYGDRVFTVVSADLTYFAGDIKAASSVAIIPVSWLEQKGIPVDDAEGIRRFACSGMYQEGDRSSLSVSVMSEDEGETVVVMDEAVFRGQEAVAYHKYRMSGAWYRFEVGRKRS